MAKKQKDKGNGVQNRPAYSRVSFLYQAATLMTTPRFSNATPVPTQQAAKVAEPTEASTSGDIAPEQTPSPENLRGISRRFVTDLRQVGLKTQIRMDPSIKRKLCKFCDTLLIEGETCTSFVENRSKDGRKPWADVLVIKCKTCQREKRFPVAAARQKRRPFRTKDSNDKEKPQVNEMPDAEMTAS
ncbi:uncharacterized protein PpBr36_09208 [Pyricularia pennisetigena]|uniref:uncharacterized protein n=1 Tax=Pyricularia pennisetigena TaxID=1578925 RepID=UPI001153CF82|nr:uncharacterized protein PpBr36_09208 [Pyricularia pennisetigena]TLS21766.1 hypothetical protein PpBr36_09208 [Pyricularia pennisetigena]